MDNCFFKYNGKLFFEESDCPEVNIGSIQIHKGIDQLLYTDLTNASSNGATVHYILN